MLKPLVLTAHARTRAESRKIKLSWIEEVARKPDWSVPDPHDPMLERRFRAIGEFGGRFLRVVCTETDTAIRVISVMFDRNARPRHD